MTSANTYTFLTDLTINYSSPADPASSVKLSLSDWHSIEKDLYLHQADQGARLQVTQAKPGELTSEDQVIVEVTVGKPPSVTDPESLWEGRPGGIWIRRSEYTGEGQQAVTGIDILFGTDAVDPRPQWHLLPEPLQLDHAPSKTPIARLTIRRGRPRPKLERPMLRAREDGSLKIVQISDTHMVTGVGSCNDAIDAEGKPLPESEADPLTVEFIGSILDVEKPDLVILTGDQLHHDILDSQTTLFKVVAPIIERAVPWAAAFGNHDSEGDHALSRHAQMALYQELPFSLCEPGPKDVYGVGNYYLQIYSNTMSDIPSSTLYLLDSHGQINADTQDPDYEAIQQSQIDWFVNTSQTLRQDRESTGSKKARHISLVYFHIPFPEFADDSKLTRIGGKRREPTEGPTINTHFYDALVQEGVAAVGAGHDHVNDFCAQIKDAEHSPWLCYNGGTGFGGYCSYDENRYYRRTRVWELNTSSGTLSTWKRLEYQEQRVDQQELVGDGKIVTPRGRSSSDQDEL
ncbi:Metallo-dependent phosphatase-like protein [Lophiotrema nucula]|uniref:Metallo-dependent phosphatase-like protein n=1 Tax=Lophiotrema nucula TaxID=690887 RepID=A0A6A5Z9T9_9PLEO|nr:Metallo-dependent phosphatase-like protein [Lophiotrema nucula]